MAVEREEAMIALGLLILLRLRGALPMSYMQAKLQEQELWPFFLSPHHSCDV